MGFQSAKNSRIPEKTPEVPIFTFYIVAQGRIKVNRFFPGFDIFVLFFRCAGVPQSHPVISPENDASGQKIHKIVLIFLCRSCNIESQIIGYRLNGGGAAGQAVLLYEMKEVFALWHRLI